LAGQFDGGKTRFSLGLTQAAPRENPGLGGPSPPIVPVIADPPTPVPDLSGQRPKAKKCTDGRHGDADHLWNASLFLNEERMSSLSRSPEAGKRHRGTSFSSDDVSWLCDRWRRWADEDAKPRVLFQAEDGREYNVDLARADSESEIADDPAIIIVGEVRA
jgi:hypothetical protein